MGWLGAFLFLAAALGVWLTLAAHARAGLKRLVAADSLGADFGLADSCLAHPPFVSRRGGGRRLGPTPLSLAAGPQDRLGGGRGAGSRRAIDGQTFLFNHYLNGGVATGLPWPIRG